MRSLAAGAAGGLALVSCLRAPIGDDLGDGSHGFGVTSDSDGPGASESSHAGDAAGTSTGGEDDDDPPADDPPAETCHPSYDPCLPIVGDLNCPDVVALGAAPVTVIGPDDYELDRDHDGIGCEN